jgi:hypothetical protein
VNHFPIVLGLSPFWSAVVTLAVAVGGAARFTRLIVNDDFPPVLWFRARWNFWTAEGSRFEHWNKLSKCPWCFGPWATALVLLWGWASDWHWHWWVLWGWLALSYITSWLVFHDEDGVPEITVHSDGE